MIVGYEFFRKYAQEGWSEKTLSSWSIYCSYLRVWKSASFFSSRVSLDFSRAYCTDWPCGGLCFAWYIKQNRLIGLEKEECVHRSVFWDFFVEYSSWFVTAGSKTVYFIAKESALKKIDRVEEPISAAFNWHRGSVHLKCYSLSRLLLSRKNVDTFVQQKQTVLVPCNKS